MIGYCDNCGEGPAICRCSWEEIQLAKRILREQARQRRVREGNPTVVEGNPDLARQLAHD